MQPQRQEKAHKKGKDIISNQYAFLPLGPRIVEVASSVIPASIRILSECCTVLLGTLATYLAIYGYIY